MIWVYDNAICKDLQRAFNPSAAPDPLVRVVSPEEAIGLAAQIQNDAIQFPIVALTRASNIEIDTNRTNFTRIHTGVNTVFDSVKNEYYKEKSMPINLSYSLTILTTSVADMDEIIKELIFNYYQTYFITIEVPYEAKRQVRFGIKVDPSGIESSSTTKDYVESGKLYQSILPLNCEGAVLLSYTPVKLTRSETQIELLEPSLPEPYITSIKE